MGLWKRLASGVAGAAVGWSLSGIATGSDSGLQTLAVVGAAMFAVVVLSDLLVLLREGPPRRPAPKWPRWLRPTAADAPLELPRRSWSVWVPPIIRYPDCEG